ncbi:hypothetical protein NCCP1664_04820 [Zafaria cholistanensis]|uniref:Uncharacterized protein n=1 Tax=Zafaria cholistanensis TaxID=1682741 RepID=A0A5A7NM56_9MICC|nr:hypothetical protein NCCP1664_04820 [Zafaria cholistanensis]
MNPCTSAGVPATRARTAPVPASATFILSGPVPCVCCDWGAPVPPLPAAAGRKKPHPIVASGIFAAHTAQPP